MADGMLSQEEIDALTKGIAPDIPQETNSAAQADLSSSSDETQNNEALTDVEKDTLGEIGNISMGSAATTLSMLLGHKVSITTPNVSIETMADIKTHYPMPYLIVGVSYTTGITGNNILAIQAGDAAIIADLMMGGDGTNVTDELDEIRQSAVSEAMNQMMGSVSTSLSQIFNKKIDISPPQVHMVDMAVADKVTDFWAQTEPVIKISFKMEVEGIIDSEIMQILPVNVSRDLVRNLTEATTGQTNNEQSAAAPVPETAAPAPAQNNTVSPPPIQPVAEPVQQQTMPGPSTAPAQEASQVHMQAASGSQNIVSNIAVQPAQFTPLAVGQIPVNNANIGLILDVPLNITVELGATKKSIRDILELSSGSVIELDKLAGEPVDVLVNGKLLAKGEVVVIDENFGVRITDIASPMERAKNLS
ncbi:flagellar motor switch phosphatase FliY [Pectinatus haikarae]|uniref:Flagellar motor switch protein FliN/FliY n=1 Tax=Pectinatus haikarae TaxID=349096 RepID=A0ABT9Y7G6_9FIRM|nr:flagellar motor switch phosphatase FliY [Pectinatus haikarae]MDQ0203770.1 flagellar motor switch protein FliN/FliY [Pectinatus haikarae]